MIVHIDKKRKALSIDKARERSLVVWPIAAQSMRLKPISR